MDLTTVAGGAAALLLNPPEPDEEPIAAAAAAAVDQLRCLLDDELICQVDAWLAIGPDTDDLLFLADLIEVRAEADPLLAVELGAIVLRSPAGLHALNALGEHCRREGYVHLRRARFEVLERAH